MRYIEKDFPVKEVGTESAKEKAARNGHIATLHLWWARRPLASTRAAIYSSLVRDTDKKFVIELSKWSNALNGIIIRKARKDIIKEGKSPKVLDPFGGGGSIPYEAMRLGCEAYSTDYNPMSVIIQKCTMEYPFTYGGDLIGDILKWKERIKKRVVSEIGRFYDMSADHTIWAKTINCPECGGEIPLLKQFWVIRKPDRKLALKPIIGDKEMKFELVENPNFDPSHGTVSGARTECPYCGNVITPVEMKKIFKEGKYGEKIVFVSYKINGRGGRIIRLPTSEDISLFEDAERYLKEKEKELSDKWGVSPVPDEEFDDPESRVVGVVSYGFRRIGEIHNPRQALALITFTDAIRDAYMEMTSEGYDRERAKILTTYMSVGLGKLVDNDTMLCLWDVAKSDGTHMFGRNAMPMVWDYAEANPIRKWNIAFDYITSVLSHTLRIPTPPVPRIMRTSATELPYDDNYFDAVITDPPYYDNIAYSHISDIFYVWWKRAVGHLYPELFDGTLTPKKEEAVAFGKNPKEKFEGIMTAALKEIHRVLKPDGIAVIIYAHKKKEGWETFINALLDSGLVVTAAWPISTELPSRLNASKNASLHTSVHFVCRKTERSEQPKSIKEEMREHLFEKLEQLTSEGVTGSDFLNASVGAGMEVVTKYKTNLRGDVIIEMIEDIAAEYATDRMLSLKVPVSPLTKFYVLWKRKFGNGSVSLKEAGELAAKCGVDLDNPLVKRSDRSAKIIQPDGDGEDEIYELFRIVGSWKNGNPITNFDKKYFVIAQSLIQSLPITSSERKTIEGWYQNMKKAGKKRRSLSEYFL